MPFGLGYAKNSFDDALRFLKAQGYTVKEMLDAGVVKQKDGRVYDVFRNRVMFPIQNVFGDVIGFGGRVMDDGIPKYLNSGETVIFNKRYNLYALNTVKKRRNLKSNPAGGGIYGRGSSGGRRNRNGRGVFGNLSHQ